MSTLTTITVAALSVALMTYAAFARIGPLSLTAALSFAAVVIGMAWAGNRQLLALHPEASEHSEPAGGDDRQRRLARANSGWLALVFGWGAAAFMCAYGLTDLYWQHWWQYGLGMLLLAGIALALRIGLSSATAPLADRMALQWLARFTAVLAAGAQAGLVFLVASGKLSAAKPDWLANHIFMAGGVAVVLIALIAVASHYRVAGQGPQ